MVGPDAGQGGDELGHGILHAGVAAALADDRHAQDLRGFDLFDKRGVAQQNMLPALGIGAALRVGGIPGQLAAGQREIGRASCRERV